MAAKTPSTDVAAGKQGPVLTARTCEHCGKQLMSNEISVVKRITCAPGGTASVRMVFFAKGHSG